MDETTKILLQIISTKAFSFPIYAFFFFLLWGKIHYIGGQLKLKVGELETDIANVRQEIADKIGDQHNMIQKELRYIENNLKIKVIDMMRDQVAKKDNNA